MLLRRESPTVLAQELVIGAADDLGHSEPRSVHDRRSLRLLRSRRSSGLRVDASEAVATCTYRAVVLKLRWPSRTWMVRRSVPASSRWVAKLCRKLRGVTCLRKEAASPA